MFNELKSLGFDGIKEISVSDITFEPSLLELCKQNQCGNYGKNYTCPPYVGNVHELIEKIKGFNNSIIFQKIYHLEDSFDIEGMNEGNADFNKLIQKVNTLRSIFFENSLLLGAGGCRVCEKCACIDKIPCRFPPMAVASLESYGINVSKLALACNMNYINGKNTVTYFGGVFY